MPLTKYGGCLKMRLRDRVAHWCLLFSLISSALTLIFLTHSGSKNVAGLKPTWIRTLLGGTFRTDDGSRAPISTSTCQLRNFKHSASEFAAPSDLISLASPAIALARSGDRCRQIITPSLIPSSVFVDTTFQPICSTICFSKLAVLRASNSGMTSKLTSIPENFWSAFLLDMNSSNFAVSRGSRAEMSFGASDFCSSRFFPLSSSKRCSASLRSRASIFFNGLLNIRYATPENAPMNVNTNVKTSAQETTLSRVSLLNTDIDDVLVLLCVIVDCLIM